MKKKHLWAKASARMRKTVRLASAAGTAGVTNRGALQALRWRERAVDAGESPLSRQAQVAQVRDDDMLRRENITLLREGLISQRENQASLRDEAAHRITLLREGLISRREDEASLRDEAAHRKARLAEPILDQLRHANEHLVLATLHAQEMSDASDRANLLKEQLLAMLAHEMRNPLAPIVNALAVMSNIKAPDPLLTWAHDIIRRQVDHMSRLIDDLLDVSRFSSGKIALQKQPTTVGEVMAQAVETSRPSIDNRKQTLTIDVPPQPLNIHGDPVRLVQVFSNLLNNAEKYTQDGGTIRFSAHQEGDTVVFCIADNGYGIAAEALDGIFDLFIQEDRSLARSKGGLGIGLTVVRGIVELHAGTVAATSGGRGKGAEFTVRVPLMPKAPFAADADADAGASASVDTVPRLPAVRYRIVLIEDNVDSNASMTMLLEMAGCEVATAFDGISGLALVQSNRPQVLLCDIGLPGMDGYAVATRLRQTMKPPLPLMIALSGYGQPADRAQALNSGFDEHIVKPADVDELFRVIAAHEQRTA